MNLDVKFQENTSVINVELQESENLIVDLTEKSGSGGTFKDGYEEGYSEGEAAGQKAEYDIFWDMLQNNGNRTNYSGAFSNRNSNWTDKSYRPKYPLKPTSADEMFYNCGVVETKIECDFSKCTSMYWTFRNSWVKHIGVVDFSSCNNMNLSFSFLENCTDIDEIICHENLKLSQFSYSYRLKNVKFSGVIGQNGLEVSHCSALTHESLMSIVNCLKDYSADTSGTTWKVTIGTTNLKKLTENEKAIMTAKGWTYS